MPPRKRGPLPPPPLPPVRRLTPPARRGAAGTGDVDPEAETPRKPVEFATYQALLGYFDAMTHAQRCALLEIAAALPDLTGSEIDEAIALVTRRPKP